MFGVDFSGLVFVWLKQVWQMLLSTSSDFKILYTYTAERRDVLGCTSPRAEGNLEVGGDVQPNSSRFEAVYGHSP